LCTSGVDVRGNAPDNCCGSVLSGRVIHRTANLREATALISMDRSTFITVVTSLVIMPDRVFATMQKKRQISLSLLSAPLELGGDWSGSPERAVYIVVSRAREACLSGIRLFSDQQAEKLRVDNHSLGPPHIWLHPDHPSMAWIIVDVGALDWCKLAYQFGHELGHVLCNSWRWGDDPKPPSQWFEESVVEAFSLRGLGQLAENWEQSPPFPHDAAFAGAIRQYRENLLGEYREASRIDFSLWLRSGRPMPENSTTAPKGPMVAPILLELERDKRCVEDMGALNRWPERTGLPIEQYLWIWEKSCKEINAPGMLPPRARALLKL
jgi:hypothetical protein